MKYRVKREYFCNNSNKKGVLIIPVPKNDSNIDLNEIFFSILRFWSFKDEDQSKIMSIL